MPCRSTGIGNAALRIPHSQATLLHAQNAECKPSVQEIRHPSPLLTLAAGPSARLPRSAFRIRIPHSAKQHISGKMHSQNTECRSRMQNASPSCRIQGEMQTRIPHLGLRMRRPPSAAAAGRIPQPHSAGRMLTQNDLAPKHDLGF